MRVAVIGAGYVGLVTAAALAELGHSVVCVDSDARKVAALTAGRLDILEPGLEQLIVRNAEAGRLTFTGDPGAVRDAVLAVIAVGTPAAADGTTDLGFVRAAARSIAPHLAASAVVAIKSTVPVGTGDEIAGIVGRPVVSNPEFLREGSAVADFMEPDRVVIGADDITAAEVVFDLYRPLRDRGVVMVTMSRRSAELTKYAANALLALKVTFANEIADIGEALNADAIDVLRAVGLDRRIGPSFLRPGPGIGGSCFPKDTTSLASQARSVGTVAGLVETVVAANVERKSRMLARVVAAAGGDVQGKTVAILGLAFKPDTDDMREAPSIVLASRLLAEGAVVRAWDPVADGGKLPRGVDIAGSVLDAVRDADAAVIVTEWEELRGLASEEVRQVMANPLIVDGRNLLDPDETRRAGFAYEGIGRPVAATDVFPETPERAPSQT